MLLIWPILWITFMLGLVILTAVVAVRENNARKKAAKAMMTMQPQLPMDDAPISEPMPDDGFGEAGQVEFADFDENAFK